MHKSSNHDSTLNVCELKYIYDGSFEGLLTAIYEAYYRCEIPDQVIAHQDLQQDLFSSYVFIETDTVKSEKVYHSIRDKISSTALENVFYVYLSDLEQAGTWIYRYLQLGWKVGKSVDRYMADDRVLQVHQVSRKVAGERHRMLGLIRFKCFYNGVYYAAIEPDYNITGLVAPHFAERLADQKWIIHDLKRNIAAVYNRYQWVITELDQGQVIAQTEEEEEYQKLWRQYYSSIAISNRINPRLQKRNMPMRYWKHLTEKERK